MQLESRSDLGGEPQLKFQPFKDQVRNLEEEIQCLKFDNERLRLHVNDITNSIGHIAHVVVATPVKARGDTEHLISEEMKIENDVIGEQTILTSSISLMADEIPLEEVTLHHEVNLNLVIK